MKLSKHFEKFYAVRCQKSINRNGNFIDFVQILQLLNEYIGTLHQKKAKHFMKKINRENDAKEC